MAVLQKSICPKSVVGFFINHRIMTIDFTFPDVPAVCKHEYYQRFLEASRTMNLLWNSLLVTQPIIIGFFAMAYFGVHLETIKKTDHVSNRLARKIKNKHDSLRKPKSSRTCRMTKP